MLILNYILSTPTVAFLTLFERKILKGPNKLIFKESYFNLLEIHLI